MAVINIGADCIDRTSNTDPNFTIFNDTLVATGDGKINEINTWFYLSTTTLRVGIFYDNGAPDYKSRDDHTIGAVTQGACRNFSVGIDLDVVAGDFIGAYWTDGKIEYSDAGGGGVHYVPGEFIDAGDHTNYNSAAGKEMSLNGVGTTGGGNPGGNAAVIGAVLVGNKFV